MATKSAAVQLSVVPDAQKQKEIENTIDAPGKLDAAIEEFKKQLADAETELAQAIASGLAAAPLDVDKAIKELTAYKSKRDTLEAKIEACKELGVIIKQRIEELKQTQPETLRSVVQAKLNELEKEAAVQDEKEALIEKQIAALKALLKDTEKPHAASKTKG